MISNFINHILFPEKDYLQSKYDDFKGFSFIMSFVASVVCAGFWAWDYVIDPIGAQSTVLLRVTMFSIGVAYVIFLKKVSNIVWVSLATLVTTISWELIFILILNRLETGMVYGISGFMFFILMPLVMMQGQSVRFNIAYLIIIAAIPHVAAIAGLAVGFQHKHYAVLIWIEVMVAVIIQIVFGYNYVMRYKAKQQLELAATTDNVTGLSNRGHFMLCLEDEIKKAQTGNISLALILLDVDNFKSINDNYGHPAGDKVLKQLADICRQNLADGDLIGRLGGEEFGMLLPGSDNSVSIAERIRQQVEITPIHTNKGSIKVTCSLGVVYWKNNESLEGFYERADKALYRAKNAGRNIVCLGA